MTDRATGLCALCTHPWDSHDVADDPIAVGFPAHVKVGQCRHVGPYELGGAPHRCHCTALPPWKRDQRAA